MISAGFTSDAVYICENKTLYYKENRYTNEKFLVVCDDVICSK